MKRKIYGRQTG
jgi:hypothetical protein